MLENKVKGEKANEKVEEEKKAEERKAEEKKVEEKKAVPMNFNQIMSIGNSNWKFGNPTGESVIPLYNVHKKNMH